MAKRGDGGGWADLAAVLFVIGGIHNGIAGLSAIFKKEYFSESGLLYENLQVWGWVWLILGLLQLIAASLLVGRASSGRILGIVLASMSAIVWFASIGAYPLWAIVVLVLDVLVIYGLTTHPEAFGEAAPMEMGPRPGDSVGPTVR
jgi:hypothetical protein